MPKPPSTLTLEQKKARNAAYQKKFRQKVKARPKPYIPDYNI